MLYFFAALLILLKVFSPTPLVGLDIDLSKEGLSEWLKMIFR